MYVPTVWQLELKGEYKSRFIHLKHTHFNLFEAFNQNITPYSYEQKEQGVVQHRPDIPHLAYLKGPQSIATKFDWPGQWCSHTASSKTKHYSFFLPCEVRHKYYWTRCTSENHWESWCLAGERIQAVGMCFYKPVMDLVPGNSYRICPTDAKEPFHRNCSTDTTCYTKGHNKQAMGTSRAVIPSNSSFDGDLPMEKDTSYSPRICWQQAEEGQVAPYVIDVRDIWNNEAEWGEGIYDRGFSSQGRSSREEFEETPNETSKSKKGKLRQSKTFMKHNRISPSN